MGFYRGPNIIRDGLVLYLDAANTKSYPGTGTTWSDLSGNGNNGTLVNGPAFNTGSNGSIVFDGVNDYTSLITPVSYPSVWSVNVTLYYYYNSKTFEFFLGNTTGDSSGKILLSYNSYISFRNSSYYNFNVLSSEISNKYSNLQFVSNGVSILLYVNGEYRSIATPPSTALPITTIGNAWSDLVWLSKFNLGEIKIYNRALTPQEVLQNYNATKSRFGL